MNEGEEKPEHGRPPTIDGTLFAVPHQRRASQPLTQPLDGAEASPLVVPTTLFANAAPLRGQKRGRTPAQPSASPTSSSISSSPIHPRSPMTAPAPFFLPDPMPFGLTSGGMRPPQSAGVPRFDSFVNRFSPSAEVYPHFSPQQHAAIHTGTLRTPSPRHSHVRKKQRGSHSQGSTHRQHMPRRMSHDEHLPDAPMPQPDVTMTPDQTMEPIVSPIGTLPNGTASPATHPPSGLASPSRQIALQTMSSPRLLKTVIERLEQDQYQEIEDSFASKMVLDPHAALAHPHARPRRHRLPRLQSLLAEEKSPQGLAEGVVLKYKKELEESEMDEDEDENGPPKRRRRFTLMSAPMTPIRGSSLKSEVLQDQVDGESTSVEDASPPLSSLMERKGLKSSFSAADISLLDKEGH